jgi:hypothetical protein
MHCDKTMHIMHAATPRNLPPLLLQEHSGQLHNNHVSAQLNLQR